MERITAEGGEGIVFKDRFSSYAPGRNADHLKFKFWHSLSALVIGVNQGKRSVAIGLLDDVGEVTPVGSVTVPANLGIPTAGSIIEVRYLYAYRGGSLFQPTLIGPRTDLLREDCKIAQVHYKAGVADELDNAA
jgi:bifunctional non-homologous end joining protein LigD